jgi:hypothetical protein
MSIKDEKQAGVHEFHYRIDDYELQGRGVR